MKKWLAVFLMVTMLLGTVSASAQGAADTITVMVPPITSTYLEDIDTIAAEFEALYPNLKIEVTKTSWNDHNTKLSTMAAAGEAPDIAEVRYSSVGKYVELGVGIEIAKYLDAERLKDYDQNALNYMSLEGAVYGLPLYITIQAIGANKEMLTAAGADVDKIQREGWSFDEFLEAIKNGTTENCFGFVFANSGVTASDFLDIFGVSAGLTNAFDEDLKYTYTSDNMMKLLTAVESMTKSGYMPNYGIESKQRQIMCQTGNAMIFGKAMPLFEINVRENNAALEANDGTAIDKSIPVQYAFLPVPTMEGVKEVCFGSVDGFIALRNKNTTDEHLKNVCLFLDYLSSGDRAAAVDATLLLEPVCASGREAYSKYEVSGLDAGNVACAKREIGLVVAPPTGITAEQSANALLVMDEVVIPKFQSLLAGEATAQDVFDAITKRAHEVFGAENCVKGAIN